MVSPKRMTNTEFKEQILCYLEKGLELAGKAQKYQPQMIIQVWRNIAKIYS